ncbi:uncharacterized protein MONBRDRAFT_31303 [Monosiga brevicollis MX1]|uniref:VPS10 domain-containing protein n=1 Tax=Monosiga brevicollis TaxID=81824 RepID=A9UR57_MONBE|nr:uncharacterized protein MONBRDRAFT_31303 [Monosiga brevicollis MX1]EDQ91861.1 predicted protein [Monosiga brevicollis MX1]|eukprot:XP_001743147.1 hypothetical protein [Monosiga brevicollis MX1]
MDTTSNLFTKDATVSHNIPALRDLDALPDRSLPEMRLKAAASPSRSRRAASTDPKIITNTLDDLYSYATIHWSGDSSPNVFVLTQRFGSDGYASVSNVYRSTDYGVSYSLLNTLPSNAVVDYLVPSPLSAKHVIFVGQAAQAFYITQDDGDSFTTAKLSFEPTELTMNPNIDGLLFARDNTTQFLYVSKDRGQTFSPALTDGEQEHRVVAAYWSRAGYGSDNDDTLYLELDQSATSTIAHVVRINSARAAVNNNAADSGDDIGQGLTGIVPGSFILADAYCMFQTGPANNRSLYVSYNRSAFQLADFSGGAPEANYMVVDALEDQIMVAVEHLNKSNLYISNRQGLDFTLSLEDVNWFTAYRTAYVDVKPIESLEGVYVATQRFASGAHVYLRTLITYDKGARWQSVRLDGCEGDQDACGLQLYLQYTGLYKGFSFETTVATQSAPGFILATGNNGSLHTADSGTYVSRDAGLTWSSVEDDAYQMLILEHGGVMVLVSPIDIQHASSVNELKYSIDEGRTFNNAAVPSSLHFAAILTEPGETRALLTIWGYPKSGFSRKWTIVSVNFTAIFHRNCNFPSDYEPWTPRDPASPLMCDLGLSEVFWRRTAKAACLNGYDFDRPTNVSACECVAEDFECDEGFERTAIDQPCVPVSNKAAKQCTPGETVTMSRGYRRVADDGCTGGLAVLIEPVTYICQNFCPVSEWTDWTSCDLCAGDEFSFRRRQKLDVTVDDDLCPCLTESRACPRPSLSSAVAIVPRVARFAVDSEIILTSSLATQSPACAAGTTVFGLVTFHWDLGTTAVQILNGASDSRSTATVSDLSITQPGIYSVVLRVNNSQSEGNATSTVIVYASYVVMGMTYDASGITSLDAVRQLLIEQFPVLLDAASVQDAELVDQVTVSQSGQQLVVEFRVLDADGAANFVERLSADIRKYAEQGKLDLTYANHHIAAQPTTLHVVSGATKGAATHGAGAYTTSPKPTVMASRDASGNKSLVGAVVALGLIICLLLGVAGFMILRRRLRSSRTYNRLEQRANGFEDELEDNADPEHMPAGVTANNLFLGEPRAQGDVSVHENDYDDELLDF